MAKPCSGEREVGNRFHLLEEAPHWYAAYTQPRHEKVVDRHLREKQIETYLPLHREVRSWKGRRAEVESPLFAGYVFVRLRLSERVMALEHPSVLSFVSFGGCPAPLPDAEITALRNLLAKRRAEPYPFLAVGKRVRIVSGSLCGLEGIVLRMNGKKTRMIVSVEFLHRSIAVDLEPGDLRAVS